MKDQLLEQFFNNPMKQFGVRELSRLTRLDTKTVMKYLKDLVKEKIIIKNTKKGSFPTYESNRMATIYKFEKSHHLIKKVLGSGVIEYLEEKIKPKAIVLFGSVAKGTYYSESDVDLFIHGAYHRVDLGRYEQKIGYKISILAEENLKELSSGLLENIRRGRIMVGELKI